MTIQEMAQRDREIAKIANRFVEYTTINGQLTVVNPDERDQHPMDSAEWSALVNDIKTHISRM